MAHKTLVGGTAYEITGGKTLVDGTAYSISGGRTLVGGTGYDIPFAPPAGLIDAWGGVNSHNAINGIIYANGYWVAVGNAYSDNTHYARIAYATSPDGEWTIRDLWSSSTNSQSINCITYVDGNWIIGGSMYSGFRYAYVMYASSPDGDWTGTTLWHSNLVAANSATVTCIAYSDDQIVVGGTRNYSSKYYAYIAYADRGGSSYSWTDKTLWSASTSSGINSICYANGYWVVGGQYGLVEAEIAYAYGSASGAWTRYEAWTNTSSATAVNSVHYANGYWVAGGNSSYQTAKLAYTTSITSAWTVTDVWTGAGSGGNAIRSITYADGRWVVCGKYYSNAESIGNCRIAYATSPGGGWTIKDLWGSNDSTHCGYDITYANDYWVVVGICYQGTWTYSARLCYAKTLEDFDEL